MLIVLADKRPPSTAFYASKIAPYEAHLRSTLHLGFGPDLCCRMSIHHMVKHCTNISTRLI